MSSDDFVKVLGQQALTNLMQNHNTMSCQMPQMGMPGMGGGYHNQQPPFQPPQQRYSRGGWDRNGGQRRDYEQPRGPGLHEKFDKLQEQLLALQQPQQQVPQQVQVAPMTAPIQSFGYVQQTPAAVQPVQPPPPPTQPPPAQEPAWVQRLVDKADATSEAVEQLTAGVARASSVADRALSTADAALAKATDQGQRMGALVDTLKSVQSAVGVLERQNGQPSFSLVLAQADIKNLQQGLSAVCKHLGVPQRGRMRTTLDANEHEAFDQQLGAAGEFEAAGEEEAEAEADEPEVAEATPATGDAAASRPRRPAAGKQGQQARRRSSGEGGQRRLSGGEQTGKRAKKGPA